MSTDDSRLFVTTGRALGLAAALTQWAVLEDRARRRKKRERSYSKWAERENRRILNSGTQVRLNPKVGRNDPCPCGSGRKFKRCCIDAGVYNSTMEKEE